MSNSFENAAKKAVDKAVDTPPVFDRNREIAEIPKAALEAARRMMHSTDPDQREALQKTIWEKAAELVKTRKYGHPSESGPKTYEDFDGNIPDHYMRDEALSIVRTISGNNGHLTVDDIIFLGLKEMYDRKQTAEGIVLELPKELSTSSYEHYYVHGSFIITSDGNTKIEIYVRDTEMKSKRQNSTEIYHETIEIGSVDDEDVEKKLRLAISKFKQDHAEYYK